MMNAFFLAAAVAVMLTVCAGLIRVFRGPAPTDRIMAVQLVGSGALGALVLLVPPSGREVFTDIALLLAVLTPVAVVAVFRGQPSRARATVGAQGGGADGATHDP